MIDKYLPIGSVCTLKGNNKKVMIIGFFSIEYNGNMKMYDYQGCSYPEGVLLKNRLVSFNHDDVEKVDYLGFKDELYDNFNNILLAQSGKIDESKENTTTISNFQFDENGVVIFDGTVNQEVNQNTPSQSINNQESVTNPFKMEYTPENRNVNQDQNEIISPYVFDENGIVISDGTVTNETQEASSSNTGGYQFDENGIVISDGTVTNETQEASSSNTGGYQFDEKGIVISDGTVTNETQEAPVSNTEGYQFDEKGIVISDGTVTNETQEVSVSNTGGYQFDENGIIISDGTVNTTEEENNI